MSTRLWQNVRLVVLFGTLAVFLYMVNDGIRQAETQIAGGERIYLQLAPVDPRSLIQGDYMRLDYQLERDIQRSVRLEEPQGWIVIRLDSNRVARFVREHDEQTPLADNEYLMRYRQIAGYDIVIGVDTFFFQEGLAERYEEAAFAEARLTADGTVHLIDLVGNDRQPLTDDDD